MTIYRHKLDHKLIMDGFLVVIPVDERGFLQQATPGGVSNWIKQWPEYRIGLVHQDTLPSYLSIRDISSSKEWTFPLDHTFMLIKYISGFEKWVMDKVFDEVPESNVDFSNLEIITPDGSPTYPKVIALLQKEYIRLQEMTIEAHRMHLVELYIDLDEVCMEILTAIDKLKR